jgi:hypothetical protein
MNRPLLYSLLILLACHVSVQGVLVGLKVPEIIVTPVPFPMNRYLGMCATARIPTALSFLACVMYATLLIPLFKVFIHRVSTLIVESILFGLVAVRAIQLKPWSVPHAHGLVTVLVRDGSWTFLCLLGQFTCAFSIAAIKYVV